MQPCSVLVGSMSPSRTFFVSWILSGLALILAMTVICCGILLLLGVC